MLYSPEEGWQLSIGSRDSSIYRNPRCDFDTESEADLLHSQQIID